MLQEHYANYYKFYVAPRDGLDGDELQVAETKATTAKDVFKALYADREEFQNDQLAKEYLNSGESEKDKGILSQLSHWASDMISQQRDGARVVSFTAGTAEDLSVKLEPFVEMKSKLDGEECGSASYWPLIRIVHVGLKSPLLARGLVIADLPGGFFNKTMRISRDF